MATYYHGSSALFPKFDLTHVLEGDDGRLDYRLPDDILGFLDKLEAFSQ